MDFVIERNIPFIKGLLEPYGTVRYLAAGEITPENMASADALITRTRTRCDAALLAGSRCSMIASATIGLDHVDMDFCRNHNIEVANAPGCNAPAVAQYVFASITALLGTELQGLTLGVIGAGHVGKIVVDWGRQLGMNVLVCDPPRALTEGHDGFCSIEDIAHSADIITVHTPYTIHGPYPTHHIIRREFLETMRRKPVIINSARGPIADTDTLKEAHARGLVSHLVIDCWENEPLIDADLLAIASIATPHIAGYSRQGKIRATRMAVDAVCRHFGLPSPIMEVNAPCGAAKSVTAKAISNSYNPLVDTLRLKSSPYEFEQLRNNYALREEVR